MFKGLNNLRGELAYRLNVPESIILASLVAFGALLPGLVTVLSPIWKGQGESAIGNIIGCRQYGMCYLLLALLLQCWMYHKTSL